MSQEKQLLLLSLGTAVLAVLIGAVLWVFLKGEVQTQRSAEDISSLLEQGQFHEALNGLKDMAPDDAERPRLERLMNSRTIPDPRFQFQKQGQPPSRLFGFKDPEIKTLVLSNEDNYRIRINMPKDGPANFLYVFQMDHDGKLHGIFPNSIYSDIVNPVSPGRMVQIPQSESDWLFYLVTPASGDPGPVSETIYLVASPWRAEDLDRFFQKDPYLDPEVEPKDLIDSFEERIRLREEAGIAAVYVETFTFSHAGH